MMMATLRLASVAGMWLGAGVVRVERRRCGRAPEVGAVHHAEVVHGQLHWWCGLHGGRCGADAAGGWRIVAAERTCAGGPASARSPRRIVGIQLRRRSKRLRRPAGSSRGGSGSIRSAL
jgi:hypothetical protein